MNCANHPEIPAVAYCQYCGKPLCEQCVHRVNNIVSCDPCLAARVGAAAGGQNAHATPGAYQYPQSGPLPPGNVQPPANWGVEPGIAIAIGWIPGVGAVYNGQIAKALVHVAVFALLIDLTHYNGLIGLLIPIWILYMWWEAYHTTVARRNGQPLPNPLGLNDVGRWFNVRPPVTPYGGVNPNPGNPIPPNPPVTPYPPYPEPPAPGAASMGGSAPFAGFAPEPGTQSYAAPPQPPIPPMPPVPPNQYDMPDFWHAHGRGIPTGAIILIVLGLGFLLANVGVLSEHWIDRGWPILLIAIGVWIVIQRSQTPRPPMPPPPPMPPGGAR